MTHLPRICRLWFRSRGQIGISGDVLFFLPQIRAGFQPFENCWALHLGLRPRLV
jgi:hypothetical protein